MVSGVKKAKELWDTWDIRILILVSLFNQVILTLLAPLRKRNASSLLRLILWLLYLSASTIALYVISQISGNSDVDPEKVDLLAFWAPFLLLHLGGPDTITALALEDNELWHRHALELATQLGVTLYVFGHSVLRHRSQLWVPTTLMFVDGCIKYFERTQALYYASIDSFRDSLETDPEPGPNYARLMDVYHSSTSACIPTSIDEGEPNIQGNVATNNNEGGPVDGLEDDFEREDTDEIVLEAYYFYSKFKGLLADNFLSLKDRKECRDIFLAKAGSEAFRIIEIELNLIYDIFYTKAFLLESKQVSLRVISFLSVVASLLWFCLTDKRNYPNTDIVVTYVLLCGAIALDLCAGVMLVLSDWYIIINSRRSKLKEWQAHISTILLSWSRKGRSPGCDRWSRSISEYNLLKRCFKDPPSFFKYVALRKIKDSLIGWLYVTSDTTQEKLIVSFIVDEIQKKAELVQDDDLKLIKKVCSARGDLVLEDDYCLISDYLQPWTTDVDYDESLLTWHLATDICYHSRTQDHYFDQVQIGKKLSDYMTYLVLRQQTLVSTVVGMSDKRFADTCAEAKIFMNKRLDSWYEDKPKYDKYDREEQETTFMRDFCESLLNVNVDVRPTVAKGDKSKSVLFEACRLAKQLKMFGEEKQWHIINKVWLELLCYAAVRCSPRSHVAQLNKGGELITLVWLLMAHLGFGDRFLQNQGFGWTKLIIQK
ncbi:uncharacterized protein LOC141607489 [Silene latifolia]|uniref:uncharacterized protein LOC141607489 n=1 Tax=Silene latifolia TaxID=37657 RepID=UPI003D77FB9F